MNHSSTYLFYDLETSGLNSAFDQCLQFAAIRTDADFQVLERHEFRVRLRPDIIPSPGALLATGVTALTAVNYRCVNTKPCVKSTPWLTSREPSAPAGNTLAPTRSR
ncbi:MAG: hypothetical protein R6X34_10410 [Chloroflexota bacterium]